MNWGKFQRKLPRVKSPGKNLIEREKILSISHYAVVHYPKVGTSLFQTKPNRTNPSQTTNLKFCLGWTACVQIYVVLCCRRIVDGTLDLDSVNLSIMMTVLCAINAGWDSGLCKAQHVVSHLQSSCSGEMNNEFLAISLGTILDLHLWILRFCWPKAVQNGAPCWGRPGQEMRRGTWNNLIKLSNFLQLLRPASSVLFICFFRSSSVWICSNQNKLSVKLVY